MEKSITECVDNQVASRSELDLLKNVYNYACNYEEVQSLYPKKTHKPTVFMIM